MSWVNIFKSTWISDLKQATNSQLVATSWNGPGLLYGYFNVANLYFTDEVQVHEPENYHRNY